MLKVGGLLGYNNFSYKEYLAPITIKESKSWSLFFRKPYKYFYKLKEIPFEIIDNFTIIFKRGPNI